MTHTPHELHAEFPDDRAILHELKMNDMHFRTLADSYHDVNRQIHRIESGVEAVSDAFSEELKKKRLALLDEISDLIAGAKKVTI
jgi:uncharacterized protein